MGQCWDANSPFFLEFYQTLNNLMLDSLNYKLPRHTAKPPPFLQYHFSIDPLAQATTLLLDGVRPGHQLAQPAFSEVRFPVCHLLT